MKWLKTLYLIFLWKSFLSRVFLNKKYWVVTWVNIHLTKYFWWGWATEGFREEELRVLSSTNPDGRCWKLLWSVHLYGAVGPMVWQRPTSRQTGCIAWGGPVLGDACLFVDRQNQKPILKYKYWMTQ